MEFAGILFIALVLGAGVHFLITLRLEKLQKIIAEFAAGKPVARAPSKLGDEVSYLINCFNDMASAISKEISERRQAEEQLRKSAAQVQDLYDNAPCGYHSLDADGLFVRINNTECDWLGYKREELLGKRKFIDLLTSESLEKFLRNFPKFKECGFAHDLTFDIVRKDGTILPVVVNATAIKDRDGRFIMSRSVVHDITERKYADETSRRLNRELRAISKCNLVLMRAADEQTLLAEVCRIICEEAGYLMAWVGYVENDTDKLVRPVAWAGEEKGYLEKAVITWSETERGCGPTGVAIRTGETVCIQDFASEAHALPWRDQALQRGYRSSIALPLKDETSRIFGVINIYSTEVKAFTPAEVRLLEELAGDLAYGISSLRARLERKRMDEALRSSEEKYRTLIEKLQAAVVVHAADTQIITCNPVAQRLLGLSEDQLLGRTSVDPSWHFMREDGQKMSVGDYPVSRVLATGQPVKNMVVGIHRPDEQSVWAMVNASPVFAGGEISQVIVTFIDITERRQTEAKLAHLAAIVESTDDAIVGKSLDERIVSWNVGAERMYGYQADEILGKPVTVLVPPDRKDEELESIMESLRRGRKVEHLETTRVRKDGQIIHVALTISPILDSAGRVIGASTIARDITARKRAEDEVYRLNAELEQRVKERTAEIAAKNAELERMNRLFVGRELRMVQLKERVASLEKEIRQITGGTSPGSA
jgi:PAS domain S-box-containing protein